MELLQIKRDIDKYIDNTYDDYKRNVKEMNSYSTLEEMLKLEESRLKNYCISVRESVVNDVELHIFENMGVDMAEEFSSNYNFEPIYFKRIAINEYDAYKTKVVKKTVNIDSDNKGNNRLTYIVVGGMAGTVVGKKFGPMGTVIGGVGGAGVGAVIGAVLTAKDSNKKDNTSTKVIEKKVKELDKQKIISILDKRKNEVKRELIDYVDNIEHTIVKFSRGY